MANILGEDNNPAYCYDSSRTAVIPRKMVQRGIVVFPEQCSIHEESKLLYATANTTRFGWEDTKHDHENYTFNDTGKRLRCCHCDEPIQVGEMYSLGSRFVNAGGDAFDCPYISGTDRIHIYCPLNYKRETTCGVEEEEFQDLKASNVDVTKLLGYNKITKEQKKKYLELVGMEINEKNLQGPERKPLEEMVFVLTGDMPDDLEYEIEKHGGKIASSVTKAVTHCIFGEATTKFGSKSGKGSKKYKQCEKKKLPLLTPEEAKELWSSPDIVKNKRPTDESGKEEEEEDQRIPNKKQKVN